jgi:hypothetical protein
LLALNLAAWAVSIFLCYRALAFLDDLVFLLGENDPVSFPAILKLLLLGSAAIWLLSLALFHLAHRAVLCWGRRSDRQTSRS